MNICMGVVFFPWINRGFLYSIFDFFNFYFFFFYSQNKFSPKKKKKMAEKKNAWKKKKQDSKSSLFFSNKAPRKIFFLGGCDDKTFSFGGEGGRGSVNSYHGALQSTDFALCRHLFKNKTHTTKKKNREDKWRCDVRKSNIFLLTLLTSTSICLQSNSRLTTSKCPYREAWISAVCPHYIFTIQQHSHLKSTSKKKKK